MKKFEIVDHGHCIIVVLTKAFWKRGVKSDGAIGGFHFKTIEEAEEYLTKLEAGVGETEEKRLRIWRVPLLCVHCGGTGLTPHSDHSWMADDDVPPIPKV